MTFLIARCLMFVAAAVVVPAPQGGRCAGLSSSCGRSADAAGCRVDAAGSCARECAEACVRSCASACDTACAGACPKGAECEECCCCCGEEDCPLAGGACPAPCEEGCCEDCPENCGESCGACGG